MRILLPIQYFYGRINKCLNKMTTVKKIILFLFGIILIVFGNKAAINTILKDNDGSKEIEPSEKETALTSPVIMEEVNAAETEAKKTDNIAITEKTTVAQSEEQSSKETTKISVPKQTEKAAKTASDAKVVEKKEEQKVKEAAKTKIEPVKEESAAASE